MEIVVPRCCHSIPIVVLVLQTRTSGQQFPLKVRTRRQQCTIFSICEDLEKVSRIRKTSLLIVLYQMYRHSPDFEVIILKNVILNIICGLHCDWDGPSEAFLESCNCSFHVQHVDLPFNLFAGLIPQQGLTRLERGRKRQGILPDYFSIKVS